jgi:hypothetical protein
VDNHDWLKLHLVTGVKTNVVTSATVSDRNANDAPFLPALVDDTARNFHLRELSADKAYSSVKNLEAIAEWGADPFVPFKSNTTGDGGGNSLWRRLWGYYQFQRDEFLPNYHKRSNVESTFFMIKAKFGGKLWSKSETGQVNEALLEGALPQHRGAGAVDLRTGHRPGVLGRGNTRPVRHLMSCTKITYQEGLFVQSPRVLSRRRDRTRAGVSRRGGRSAPALPVPSLNGRLRT